MNHRHKGQELPKKKCTVLPTYLRILYCTTTRHSKNAKKESRRQKLHFLPPLQSEYQPVSAPQISPPLMSSHLLSVVASICALTVRSQPPLRHVSSPPSQARALQLICGKGLHRLTLFFFSTLQFTCLRILSIDVPVPCVCCVYFVRTLHNSK